MPSFATELLHSWHDFFLFFGTAAATLIGAMFVVASIGLGVLTRERAPETRAFLTPTVLHLATVLFGCALMLVPGLEVPSLAALLGLGAAAGLIYSGVVGVRLLRRRIDADDRVWYAVVPCAAYAVGLAAAFMIALRSYASLYTLAIGFALLLIAGIRNAWDLIIFFVAQPRDRQ